jgi:hypothetical protein
MRFFKIRENSNIHVFENKIKEIAQEKGSGLISVVMFPERKGIRQKEAIFFL